MKHLKVHTACADESCVSVDTLKISRGANLVIYTVTAHGQSCFFISDRHSRTPSSGNKKCQLTLGKGYGEAEVWTGTSG